MKCSICNNIIKNYGHDPRPVKSKGKVCDNCFVERILPERFEQPEFKTNLKKVKKWME